MSCYPSLSSIFLCVRDWISIASLHVSLHNVDIHFTYISFPIIRGPLANQHVRSSKLLTAILLFLPFSPMTSSPNTSAVRGKGDEDKYQNGKNHTIRLGRRARSLNELIVGTVAKMSFLFVITCSLLKVHQSTSFIGRGKEEGFGIYFKQLLVSYMYGLGLFCFLGAGMDISGSIVSSVFNIDLKPNFEMPFASTSHCEFWSQRWNITTASLLKQLIYDPICEARLVRNEGSYEQQQKFKPLVKFFGIAMTFLVSGLMHDVVLFAITREKRIIWSYYFWYGAIFVLVEHTASMVMPSLTFPKWMKTLYTTMSITILGDRFFIAPVSTRGIDVAVLNELMCLFNLRI